LSRRVKSTLSVGPQQVTGPFEQYADMPAGTDGIIKKIRDRVGTDNPVYLSIDIDTLDPACKFLPRFQASLF
jgi:hypothetical protein